MNVIDRRLFNYSILEEVCPEDRKLSKRMDINEIIIVFLIEPKYCFSQLIGWDIPIKVIIKAIMCTFQA